jgi:hypothetical protein
MLTNNLPAHMRVVAEQQDSPENEIHLPAEALLQASRRVDWRFLLPDPNLGQVAYLGSGHDSLVESLRAFSVSLTHIETALAGDHTTEHYDVVVTSDPSYETLRIAASLVRPGGFLYVEVAQFSSWLRYSVDYAAVIERLGFTEVQAHWHWPDFKSCTKIIPLAGREALRFALATGRGDLAAWLKALLGRWFVQSGVLARLAPCFSVIAQRGLP